MRERPMRGQGTVDEGVNREQARRQFLRVIRDDQPQVLEDLRRLLPKHRLIFRRLIPADMTEEEYAASLRRKKTPFSGVLLHERGVEELIVTGMKPPKPPVSRRSRYIFALQAQPESLRWLHDELTAWCQRHHLQTDDRYFVRQALYQLADWRCTKTPERGSWGGEAVDRPDSEHYLWLAEYQVDGIDGRALAEKVGQERGALLRTLHELAGLLGLVLRSDGDVDR